MCPFNSSLTIVKELEKGMIDVKIYQISNVERRVKIYWIMTENDQD
ncbi:MAG: hypothetical protein ACI8RD_005752 [Bacillariaceae sp.]|jgi:hypothetical protein